MRALLDNLPAGLRGVMLAAMLAAFMSTVDTQLNWGASYLTNDSSAGCCWAGPCKVWPQQLSGWRRSRGR